MNFSAITGATATTASKAVKNLGAYLSKTYREDFGAPARTGSSITFADGMAAIVVGFDKSDKTFTNKETGETEHYNNPVWEVAAVADCMVKAQALVDDGKLRARDGEPTEAAELLGSLNLNKASRQVPTQA